MVTDDVQSMNTDAEIQSAKQDGLNRALFAVRVANRIHRASSGPSIVFGLAGPWGSGKSSVLNMIEEHMTDRYEGTWILARLTPWAADDVTTLVGEFYNCVASAMPDTEPGRTAAKKLRAMAPVAVAVGKAVGHALVDRYIGEGATAKVTDAAVDAIADSAGSFRFKEEPFVEKFAKVSDAIEDAGFNFLVIVDDVDRLHVDELLSLFKAVRLLGRFNRVHYLLSYDEQTVLDVLQRSDIANGSKIRAAAFLEKIIQYPLVLPPVQDVQLDEHLWTKLNEVADIHAVSADALDEDRPRGPVVTIITSIPQALRRQLTIRSVNRFASQLDVLLTLVGGNELNFVDAALITYLRLHHRALYDHLPRWRNEITGAHRVSFTPSSRDEIDWRHRIAAAIGVEASDPLIDQLHEVLGTLFPRVSRFISPPGDVQRICQSAYFPRYFAFGIPVNDVADAQIESEFSTLCATGRLPAGSAIASELAELQSWSPVLAKVRHNVHMVDTAEAQSAFDAAVYVSDYVQNNLPALSGWLSVAARLLHRAIGAATESEVAAEYVKSYLQQFGLLGTTRLLAATRSDGDADSSDAIIRATEAVRVAVVDACKRDLTTDLEGEPETARFIDFLPYLDDDRWAELSAFANEEIASQRTHAYELAGRFVRTPTPGFEAENEPYTFLSSSFLRLVPQDQWDAGLPPSADEPIPADGLLANRISFAVKQIRRSQSGEA